MNAGAMRRGDVAGADDRDIRQTRTTLSYGKNAVAVRANIAVDADGHGASGRRIRKDAAAGTRVGSHEDVAGVLHRHVKGAPRINDVVVCRDRAAAGDIDGTGGRMSKDAAAAYIQKLKTDKRYQRDVY